MKSILLCLLFSVPITLFAHDAKKIPEKYLGEWIPDVKYCDNLDILRRIKIRENRITYWESGGSVLSLYEKSPLEFAAIMDFNEFGGGSWIGLAHFMLSTDHKMLTQYVGRLDTIVLFKCDKKS